MAEEKLKKKVYISGQITGLLEKEYKKLFDSATEFQKHRLKTGLIPYKKNCGLPENGDPFY